MATEAYAQRYGFSAAWGRVFLPYGPGDEPHRLIPSLLAALSAGTPINVTDGSQVRDFVYAADVADLLARLLPTPEAQRGVQYRHGSRHRRAASDRMAGRSFRCA